VLLHYQKFESSIYPFGDESIINCMIWRDGLNHNLGDIFICSHYFSPYIIEAALKVGGNEEYERLFDINYRISKDEDSFILEHGWTLARHNRIGLINNNYRNLLFLHGCKNWGTHEQYLNILKET